jgi:hypothetical protein
VRRRIGCDVFEPDEVSRSTVPIAGFKNTAEWLMEKYGPDEVSRQKRGIRGLAPFVG